MQQQSVNGGPTFAKYRRLATAIFIRALRDVQSGNGFAAEAREWLESPYAEAIIDALDLNPDRLSESLFRVKKGPSIGTSRQNWTVEPCLTHIYGLAADKPQIWRRSSHTQLQPSMTDWR